MYCAVQDQKYDEKFDHIRAIDSVKCQQITTVKFTGRIAAEQKGVKHGTEKKHVTDLTSLFVKVDCNHPRCPE